MRGICGPDVDCCNFESSVVCVDEAVKSQWLQGLSYHLLLPQYDYSCERTYRTVLDTESPCVSPTPKSWFGHGDSSDQAEDTKIVTVEAKEHAASCSDPTENTETRLFVAQEQATKLQEEVSASERQLVALQQQLCTVPQASKQGDAYHESLV